MSFHHKCKFQPTFLFVLTSKVDLPNISEYINTIFETKSENKSKYIFRNMVRSKSSGTFLEAIAQEP